MTSPPYSMKDPLLDCLYHGLLRFASLPTSKRAHGVHSEFFDESNPLAVKAYAKCPHPSLGAGFFIWVIQTCSSFFRNSVGAAPYPCSLSFSKQSRHQFTFTSSSAACVDDPLYSRSFLQSGLKATLMRLPSPMAAGLVITRSRFHSRLIK